jgi:hypothetical protein
LVLGCARTVSARFVDHGHCVPTDGFAGAL